MEPNFEDKKKIAEFFFEVENEEKREFKCKLCSGREISKFCISKKGYENLMSHLESKFRSSLYQVKYLNKAIRNSSYVKNK